VTLKECAVTDGHEESAVERRELVIPRVKSGSYQDCDLQTDRTVRKETINCNSK
jgi:hypothetical protein